MNKKNINWAGIALIAILALTGFITTCACAQGQLTPVLTDQGVAEVTASELQSLGPVVVPASSLTESGRPGLQAVGITVEVTPVLGPLKSSPNWATFVSHMRAGNYGTYHKVDHFDPMYVTAPTSASGVKMWLGQVNPTGVYANEVGNTLWFMVHVKGVGQKFLPGFQVIQTSEPNNLFGKVELVNQTNLSYNGTSWASINNDNGTQTTVENGLWSQAPVSEFWWIGSAASTMNANDNATAQSNAGWFNSNVDDLHVEYLLGGNPSGYGDLILPRVPPVVVPSNPPILTITRGVGSVTVKVTGLGSRTGEFQSRIGNGDWAKVLGSQVATENSVLQVNSPDQLVLIRVKVN